MEHGRDNAVNWPLSFRLNFSEFIGTVKPVRLKEQESQYVIRKAVSQDGFSRYRDRHESADESM